MTNGNNGNNGTNWKVSVAEFRGFVKATLENLNTTLEAHGKSITIVKNDIQKIHEYMAGQKAVQRFKGTFYGVIGGGIFTLAIYIIQKVVENN